LGYYIRFISTDERPLEPVELRRVLALVDSAYSFEFGGESMTIHHAGSPIGHLRVRTPDDARFAAVRADLLAAAAQAKGSGRPRVLETLRAASAILTVEVLFGTGETESTLVRLDPLWAWLVDHRDGLIQADGEGYYDAERVVLRQG
jgi:hypothetical protein